MAYKGKYMQRARLVLRLRQDGHAVVVWCSTAYLVLTIF